MESIVTGMHSPAFLFAIGAESGRDGTRQGNLDDRTARCLRPVLQTEGTRFSRFGSEPTLAMIASM